MIQDTVVIGGECSLETRIEGDCDLTSMVEGDPDVLVVEGGGQTYPHYSGSYTVTPSTTAQVLDTDGKVMDDDVTVNAVAQGSATTPATIITANPSISVSSGGLITATVSKTQQITPTVIEGYVSAGTPGNVGVSGSNTQQLTTQGAQTIYPSSTDQSIASGKYLTGTQTFKGVTVTGLTADKVLQGNVVKIGDADDDDRIMSVTGTAQGGITPTGTKTITANGTGIDVYSYQYADVAVPNSYSASDEGKVVSNGALVAQTSDTVTANDTYDTTLINSLTVNVSGGGGISVDDIAEKNISGAITLNTATSIKERAFNGYNGITSIESDSVTTISGSYAMSGMTALQSVSLPNLTGLSSYTFSGDTDLEIVNIPKVTGGGGYNFQNCKKLVKLALPAFNGATNASFADGATLLEKCDLGNCTRVQSVAFRNTSLNILVLRRTSLVVLDSTNIFTGTPFASGGAGGTIYIPKVLYDALGTGTNDYKSATNWSTVNGYGTITWAKIEGSYYETHYADDTAIPTT